MKAFANFLDKNPWVSLFFWVLFSFIVYGQTLDFQYALDDGLVLSNNKLVQQGISGIPELFSHSHTYGYSGKEDAGYRPLTSTVYALVVEFIPENAGFFHLLNVLFYGIGLFFLFQVVKRLSKDFTALMALVITLLYAVHPLHTEVVANIKGLEDILAFGLSFSGFYFAIRWADSKKDSQLYVAAFVFFLALLSKEISLPFIAAVCLYLVWIKKISKREVALLFSTLAFPIIGYVILRVMVSFNGSFADVTLVNNAMANSPMLERIGTALWIQFLYIIKLAAPFTLTSDYSYGSIDLVSLFSLKGMVGLLFSASFIFATYYWSKSKTVFSFLLLFYGFLMLLTSNFFFLIGTAMAERFVFISSISPIVIAVAVASERFNKKILAGIFIVVFVLFWVKTHNRTEDWYNNATLFEADIETTPNSFRIQTAYANIWRVSAELNRNFDEKEKLYETAIVHYKKSLEILPSNAEAWYNMGVIYQTQGKLKEAQDAFLACVSYSSDYAFAYNNLGVMYFNAGQYDKAELEFEQAYALNKQSVDILLNMGLIQHQKAYYSEAEQFYLDALQADSKSVGVLRNLVRLYRDLNDVEKMNFYRNQLSNSQNIIRKR